MPKDSPAHVVKAAKRMLGTALEMEKGMVERVDDDGTSPITEVGFDNGKDGLWKGVKSMCVLRAVFANPSFGMLSPEVQAQINLPRKRELAEYARQLDSHLFGRSGLGFLQAPFAEQVVHTRIRLKFIRDSPAAKHYVDVLTPELVMDLEAAQARYELMVRDRSLRADSFTNLRRLRTVAQRHIAMYSAAMITTIDEESQESIDVVFAALQPMVNARVRRNYGTSEETEESGETILDGVDIGAELGAILEDPILGPPEEPVEE